MVEQVQKRWVNNKKKYGAGSLPFLWVFVDGGGMGRLGKRAGKRRWRIPTARDCYWIRAGFWGRKALLEIVIERRGICAMVVLRHANVVAVVMVVVL